MLGGPGTTRSAVSRQLAHLLGPCAVSIGPAGVPLSIDHPGAKTRKKRSLELLGRIVSTEGGRRRRRPQQGRKAREINEMKRCVRNDPRDN